MAGLLAPLVESAVDALGPALARGGAALLGGAATAGTASLSGDSSKDDSKAAPVARTLPRTDESCKKCPPEQTGQVARIASRKDGAKSGTGRPLILTALCKPNACYRKRKEITTSS